MAQFVRLELSDGHGEAAYVNVDRISYMRGQTRTQMSLRALRRPTFIPTEQDKKRDGEQLAHARSAGIA